MWPFSDVLLTFFVIERASPTHTIPDMTDPSETDLEWKRQSVEGDNDICELDHSPASLAVHVQLAQTPCKCHVLFCS